MKVHGDSLVVVVHVYIWRGNVRSCDFGSDVVRERATKRVHVHLFNRREVVIVDVGWLGDKTRFSEMERTGWMNMPWTGYFICVRESNVAAFVISEIEVIAAERSSNPIRDFDERWALDVVADAAVISRRDDRSINQSGYLHRVDDRAITWLTMPSWLLVSTEHLHAVVHEGEGPVAFLVHGALGSRSYWHENISALQEVCRPVVVELWGHGRSPSPDDVARYEPAGYVAEFDRLRAELEAEQVWLVGQSMGAALVMHYSVAKPHRVKGMIISNSASGFADPEEWRERNRTVVSQIADQVDAEGVECLRDSWVNPGRSRRIGHDTLELLAEEFTEHSAAGITASFRTTNYSLPLGDSLGEISVPVLFTNGVEEEGFQKHLPRVRLIPQVEIVDLPASHAVNAHDPRGWNRAAVDFIKRHTDIGV